MLKIENLKVRSLDADRKEVTWETSDDLIDVYDYTFQVLRSESPEGPFDVVSPVFQDRFIFVDHQIPGGDKHRQLWYKIRLTHKASGETADYGPAALEAEADLIARYIRRAEQTLLLRFNGRQCWLYKKRTFGPRCTSCWDKTTKKRMRANCLECFDTGFLRGYLDPIQVQVQIDPAGKGKLLIPQQITSEVMTQARMVFYPEVRPGDVLVEAENKRWRITQVQTSERLRAPVLQTMVLRQIDTTDIEYRLPLNLDRALKDIQPSPVVRFTNPTGLHNYFDRVPDVSAAEEFMPKAPVPTPPPAFTAPPVIYVVSE